MLEDSFVGSWVRKLSVFFIYNIYFPLKICRVRGGDINVLLYNFHLFFNMSSGFFLMIEIWLVSVWKVTFGILFNDDRCANIFEALVGTLRAAKKRKVLTYDGELLLQGVHDNVEITLKPTPAAVATATVATDAVVGS